ncbi:type II toxin-antitoxin system RelE/ParE family toxin [Rhodohalobacter sp.]|uniref:type II toxin-antitoxin system RelE/ParE family toxin n=1 Tax=Rhodohalobacter sp. TaxID=1974210 RepID=UPI002ACE0863|nr:type II toxin-antitoxin system RelE/ParE family toxin [Rhodohalobacter sp.]MDZ7757910.1 hypothetical protein [Rhodohalobacter sp.]
MKIRIKDSAKKDLVDGFKFYELQETGLGSYFLDSLFEDIDSLRLTSGIHPLKFDRYHYLLAHRFPFAIYYTVKNKLILIHAILDCRQNPLKASDRLS